MAAPVTIFDASKNTVSIKEGKTPGEDRREGRPLPMPVLGVERALKSDPRITALTGKREWQR